MKCLQEMKDPAGILGETKYEKIDKTGCMSALTAEQRWMEVMSMAEYIDRQAAIDAYGDWYVEEGTADIPCGDGKE